MIKGRDNIINWLRVNNSPFWKIYNISKTGLLGESDTDENLTMDGSIAEFERRLDIFGGGQYFVEAWKKSGQTKDRLKTSFEYGEVKPEIAGIGSIMTPQIDVREEVARAIKDYQQEQELISLRAKVIDLQAQLKKAESESDGGAVERIVKRLEPFVPGLLGIDMNAPQVISGTGDQDPEKLQQRLENAFERWGNSEKQTVEIIEKIAEMAEKDPETYKMARRMLLA